MAKVQRLFRELEPCTVVGVPAVSVAGVVARGDLVVHAEAAVAAWFLTNRARRLPAYIGISMACCLSCSHWMRALYNSSRGHRSESAFSFANTVAPQSIQGVLHDLGRVALTPRDSRDRMVSGTQRHLESGSEPDEGEEGRQRMERVRRTLVYAAAIAKHAAVTGAAVAADAAGGGGGDAPRFVLRGRRGIAVAQLRIVLDVINGVLAKHSDRDETRGVLRGIRQRIETATTGFWHDNSAWRNLMVGIIGSTGDPKEFWASPHEAFVLAIPNEALPPRITEALMESAVEHIRTVTLFKQRPPRTNGVPLHPLTPLDDGARDQLIADLGTTMASPLPVVPTTGIARATSLGKHPRSDSGERSPG